jgi:hypothetical protein
MLPIQSFSSDPPFPVKVTAVGSGAGSWTGKYQYTWTEQAHDPTTGSYTDAQSPRSGAAAINPLLELNNRNLATFPFFAWVRFRAVLFGQPTWEFDSSVAAVVPPLTVNTPAQITADQNDYDPGAYDLLRLTTDATRTITGIAGGYPGRSIWLTNTGSFDYLLSNQNASSTATNRIVGPYGGDVLVKPGRSVELIYDGTTGRWRPSSGSALLEAPAGNTLTIGATIAGNPHLSGTPTIDTLAGDTHFTGTPQFDHLPVFPPGTDISTLGGIPALYVTNGMLAGSIDLTAKVTGALPVANGGTGRASDTAYAVICGGTTSTAAQQSIASVGTSGQVLTSNGAGALPTFQTLATGGTVTSVSGTTNQVSVATGTTTPVISLAGPHGYTPLTSHGLLVGAGTSAVAALAVMTNGQLAIGQTGADPAPTTVGGDATLAADGTLTIGSAKVTYAKIQNTAAHSLVGNASAGAAAPSDVAMSVPFVCNGTLNLDITTCTALTAVDQTADLLVLHDTSAAVPKKVAPVDLFPYLQYEDQKTAGTNGGTFTSGAWQTRTLNTEVTDTHNLGTLASNQITLAAGTYEIIAHCVAGYVDSHQARLQNITAGTTLLTGTCEYGGHLNADWDGSRSFVQGRFTVAASQALELQHRCQTTKATNGFGVAFNITTEVYSRVVLRRVG